ncbi:hypothetical protein KC316_g5060 [Hortaea werneckii]|nr:hypothetical protein KC324_g5152 [Hortaea werneckii]KAI7587435.1 hypothetical protein KC316_g5060 [Hortaea werneckii]
MNGEDALYECYGIDPDEARQESQTTESEKMPEEEESPEPERAKKKAKRSQRFGACRIHLCFLPGQADDFLYAADLLNGRNEGSVDEVVLESLQRAVEPKLEDKSRFARDKTGDGLKMVVRATTPTMVKDEDQSS